jgi:hypothetical protein
MLDDGCWTLDAVWQRIVWSAGEGRQVGTYGGWEERRVREREREGRRERTRD